MRSSNLRLYIFTLSHYCEKALWALDHKRVVYRKVTLLPGLHMLATRRIAPHTRVPILVDGERVVQDSGPIIDYLDDVHPERRLTPAESEARLEVERWEAELDRELGKPGRRVFYQHALGDRAFMSRAYAMGGPSWATAFYRVTYPAIARAVRRMYSVTAANAERDLARVEALFARLDAHLERRRYLVGGAFSRADIALAALAAPIVLPDTHAVWGAPRSAYPAAWIEQTRRLRESLTAERVRQLYREHRSAPFA